MILTHSFQSHYPRFFSMLISTILAAVFILSTAFFSHNNIILPLKYYPLIIIAFFASDTPRIYLHIEYWIKNRNKIFVLTPKKIRIVTVKNKRSLSYKTIKKGEFKKIILYKFPDAVEIKTIATTPGYAFLRIISCNSEDIFITSILSRKIEGIDIRKFDRVPLNLERIISVFSDVPIDWKSKIPFEWKRRYFNSIRRA